MRTKRYAGEGRPVHEFGDSFLTRPIDRLKSILLRLVGRKTGTSLTLSRDFYAKLTSPPNYVIMGEERYGLRTRVASLKKPKPIPPQ